MPSRQAVPSPLLQRLGLAVLAGLAAVCLLAAAPAHAEDEARENVELSGSHSDVQFLAGRSVRVTATVTDDVFAAGRYVTFDGADIANAIVAGYAVEQRGGTLNDMIAAGESVTVGGMIRDDMIAFARSIRIRAEAQVEGDARMAAETIEVDGSIGGSLKAAGRQITLNGTIEGKADLAAERIVVGPNATISGDLVYRSDSEPEISPTATISGEVRRVELALPEAAEIGMAMIGIGIAIAVGWALAVLAVVAIMLALFPDAVSGAARRFKAQPWASLGIGVAGTLVAAALMGGAFFSVFALPLGMALLLALGTVKLFGLTAIAGVIGLFVARKRGEIGDLSAGPRIGWSLLGAIILLAVFFVPLVGTLIAALAVAAGMGAAAVELWRRLRGI